MTAGTRATRRPAVLAVDGGGSKTDAVLLTRGGAVVAARRVRSKGWYAETGDAAFIDQIGRAVAAVCEAAGVPTGDGPVAEIGMFCVAGADLPVDHRRITRGLGRRGWAARDVVRNDTFAVLRAGTDRGWGVAVVCGSGMNCTGVAPDGRVFRFPAMGALSGDWGGGYDLGETAMWHAIRAEDGRGDRTSLREAVPARFGFRRPSQLMRAIYLGRLHQAALRELAPVVFDEAVAGDPIARAIADRQADEIVRMAATAIRRLRLDDLEPDVVLGGGVVRGGDPEFLRRIDDGILEAAARARIVRLDTPPIVGAAMLGLDEVGATAAAHTRTRDALTHDRLTADTDERAGG